MRIGRLLIRGGEVQIDHQRVPLDLDLPGFEGQLRQGAGRALAGHVAFGPGDVRFGSNPPLPLTTEMELAVEGPRVSVSSGHLRAEGTDITYRGALEIAPLRGQFQVSGPADLDVLERHVIRTGLGVRGDARFDGAVLVEGSRIGVRGHLEGSAGSFDGVPVPRYGGEVVWDERGVHPRRFEVDARPRHPRRGGSPTAGHARLSGQVRGMDAEGLRPDGVRRRRRGDRRRPSPVPRAGMAAGPRAEPDGNARPRPRPARHGRTPLSGRVGGRAESGVQIFESAELRTLSMERARGRIERDGAADLAVDAESRDLAASDELPARVRQALGAARSAEGRPVGSWPFHGRWGGTISFPSSRAASPARTSATWASSGAGGSGRGRSRPRRCARTPSCCAATAASCGSTA